jgi:hypothetical protein
MVVLDYETNPHLKPAHTAYVNRGFAYSNIGNNQQAMKDLKIAAN